MSAVYEQGDLVTLDLYIYDADDNLVDPDGWNAGDPPSSTEPTCTVKDPLGVIIQTAQLGTRISAGYFQFSYQLENDALTGYWAFEWVFKVAGAIETKNYRTERFLVSNPGSASYQIDNLANILRLRLKDNHPDYRKQRWTDEELFTFIQNGLWDINVTPPATTYFFMDDYYDSVPEWKSLIIDGALIFALQAQGIFEIGKEFSYSDNGISITIDRSNKYFSIFNTLTQMYMKSKELVKKQYFMKTLNPHVIKSGELEQRLRTYAPSQYRIR
jgi:hypothetical protein